MKQLVLVGAGHAHAQVLLNWATHSMPGVAITVVSPEKLAPYSGMVPGWLAGDYAFGEIVIDFLSLCEAAGARWVEAELVSVQDAQQTLTLSNGDTLVYDVLSLNVGSTLRQPAASTTGATIIAMRPLSGLRLQYESFLTAWAHDERTAALTVTAVGGGAAGFESVLAVLRRLRTLRPDRVVEGSLVSHGLNLLPGFSTAAQSAAESALRRADVQMQLGSNGSETTQRPNTLVLWATGAQAHAWQLDPLRRGNLAVNPDGFVRVDAQLRSISNPQVFAVGDCAHWDSEPQALPKAGVYAVRMGPVLDHNLRAALGGKPLQSYAPQRRFLALLTTSDGGAIASRGSIGASGRWAWLLKNYIDRRFIGRFAVPTSLLKPEAKK